MTLPEPGEYVLLAGDEVIRLASLPTPRDAMTTTVFVLRERAEAAALLRRLGADPSHLFEEAEKS